VGEGRSKWEGKVGGRHKKGKEQGVEGGLWRGIGKGNGTKQRKDERWWVGIGGLVGGKGGEGVHHPGKEGRPGSRS